MDDRMKRLVVPGAVLAVGAMVAFGAAASLAPSRDGTAGAGSDRPGLVAEAGAPAATDTPSTPVPDSVPDAAGPGAPDALPSGPDPASAPSRPSATDPARAALLAHVAEVGGWEPAEVEAALLEEAARVAWGFVDRNHVPATGLVKATDSYEHITTWDVGSVLAAHHAGAELGFLERAEAVRRLERALATLAKTDLFDGAAYNKVYSATTGRMVGHGDRPSAQGLGWSATDLGRFLLWLRIVATSYPELADEAREVAERMDYGRLIRDDGYLAGEELMRNGRRRRFQEGRLGYEQYVARGFEVWGHDVPGARDALRHAVPTRILGTPLLVDERGMDRLTSEPFVLMGMEVGWPPEVEAVARSVLAVQRARWEQTGQVTVVSEDALDLPPHYFYYYNVYHEGEPFQVDAQGPLDAARAPRWVSAKAAFGWYVLVPSDYTRLAVETVRPAADPGRGWASGVFEGRGGSTRSYNLNTAAIILEAALYARRGTPFLKPD